jgi:hypothetical protein
MANQALSKRKLNQGIMQFVLLTILIVGVGGYFGYTNYSEYQTATAALDKENQMINELKASADKSKQDYLALKKDMEEQNVGVNAAIEKILPSNEDYTNLARKLDEYFLNTANTANPMFLSNLTFDPPIIEKDAELAKLPFKMTFEGNETSFIDFLKYLENSGDLNEKTRLMDMDNLSFTLTNPIDKTDTPVEGETMTPSYTTKIKEVMANITLNAYFQKPVIVNPTN